MWVACKCWYPWLLQSRILYFPLENQVDVISLPLPPKKKKIKKNLHASQSIKNKIHVFNTNSMCLTQTNLWKPPGLIFATISAVEMTISSFKHLQLSAFLCSCILINYRITGSHKLYSLYIQRKPVTLQAHTHTLSHANVYCLPAKSGDVVKFTRQD